MNAIFTFLLIAVFCAGLDAQCKNTQIEDYLIYIDVTDEEHLKSLNQFMPDEYKAILSDLESKGVFAHCRGTNIEIYPINDLGDNRGSKFGFDPISTNMTDVQIERQIKPIFAANLRNAIKEVISSANSSYKFTRIYEPLCNALIRRKSINKPITIIVFSDMLEHNSTSFYRKGQSIDMEKTILKLSEGCHCNFSDELSNITIKFISFRTSSTDRNISSAIKFWVEFFESRKAKVYFGSSLK